MSGKVQFNLTPEQQERFNEIYEETKKVHPELVADEVGKQRVKVLIAYTVINGDAALKPKNDDFDNVFEEVVGVE